MRQIRLYTPQTLQANTTVELDEVAANHLGRVLRARVGDPVTLFNGDGNDWQATVSEVSKKSVSVTVGEAEPVTSESPVGVHLGLCLSKGERFDWAIQKATEMGVASITPLFSERVDVKLPADRAAKRLAHWQQIAISACEQCGRAVVPQVAQPQSLEAWVGTVDADLKLVMHHHQEGQLPEASPSSVALLVGPEGGLTEAEVTSAKDSGFLGLRLGPRVMRTETAPIAALAVIGDRWGDLQ